MRLRTIWTIPAMSIGERLRRSVDWAALTTASHLPRRVMYWAAMVAIGKATSSGPHTKDKHVMAIPLDEVLKNLPGGPKS